MSVLYRILGLAALIGQRLSRTRINFVPLNWALMAGLGVLLVVALGEASDGFTNAANPQKVTLAQIVSHDKAVTQNYVQVRGTLFPDSVITSTRRRKYESAESAARRAPSQVWIPLAERDANGKVSAVLVQMRDVASAGGPPREATITGRLKSLDGDVARKVSEDGASDISQEYVLVEKDKPGSGWTWGLIALLSGVSLAMLAATFLMKYVVFQKQGAVTLPLPGAVTAATFDAPEVVTQATGQFFFTEHRDSQRFLNVPAWLTESEDGNPMLVANVDASSRFFGITTNKRSGLWVIPLSRMAGATAEKGTLYLGAKALPSLRFQTPATPETGAAQTVILSADNDAEREQLIAALVTPRSPRASDVAPPPTSSADAAPTGEQAALPTSPASPPPFDL